MLILELQSLGGASSDERKSPRVHREVRSPSRIGANECDGRCVLGMIIGRPHEDGLEVIVAYVVDADGAVTFEWTGSLEEGALRHYELTYLAREVGNVGAVRAGRQSKAGDK